MELPSVAPLPNAPRVTTSEGSQEPLSSPLSKVAPAAAAPSAKRILDFDTESLAAGFADPEWVPQKITCSAWSWVGEDVVHHRICGIRGFFIPEVRAKSLRPLVAAIRQADIVRGHNLARHDLPVLNAECLRLGLGPLPPLQVQDSIKIVRTKGFKKGQDNLARLLKLEKEKLAMDWQAWEDAYAEAGWPTVIARCVSDVEQHKQLWDAMSAAGWLKPMTVWRP